MRHYGPTFGEALFSVIGILLGYLAAVLFQGVKVPDNLPSLATAVLGGSAALTGAALAWRGFHRWEERHRKERDARIAGKVLVTAAELVDVLKATRADITLFRRFNSPIPRRSTLLRWKEQITESGLRDRFRAARIQVRAHLTDDFTSALQPLRAAERDFVNALVIATNPRFRPENQFTKEMIEKLYVELERAIAAGETAEETIRSKFKPRLDLG